MIMEFEYTNWRGEARKRSVVPIEFWFGSTEWHKEDQWLLKALDVETRVIRDFAVKDIRFPPIEEPGPVR